jgi:biotin synthase-related radical SAM superfamily protein
MKKSKARESPRYVRMSQAAAMVLGYKTGLFYRGATSPCINILLNYEEGCAGNCAYCGLSLKRPGAYTEKSFIRVQWDIYELADVIEHMKNFRSNVKRSCISMVTNRRAINDTNAVLQMLKDSLALPMSVLASPTIMTVSDLRDFKNRGADRLGIAVDAATPQLFERYRGKGVHGPHKWERYWQLLDESIGIFGKFKVGMHLIVGLGETEEEMIRLIQDAHDRGIETHLFTFFPEPDSLLASHPPPAIGQYRRVQLARYLINTGQAQAGAFRFGKKGRLMDSGMPEAQLELVIDSGRPFMTSGCSGSDGEVACNRPYSDSLPGPDIRNFPFLPDAADIKKIRSELRQ